MTLIRRLWIALLLLLLAPSLAPAAAVTRTGDGHLAIDGTKTFLIGISMYDCGNWHQSDVDYLMGKGFNWFICHIDDVLRNDANSGYNADGTLRSSKTTDFTAFANYVGGKGGVVTFILLYADTDGQNSATYLTTAGARQAAIENATNAFCKLSNVLCSVVNEHNYGSFADTHAEMDTLFGYARAQCAGCLMSYSSSDNIGLDSDAHIWTTRSGSTVDTANVAAELASGIDLFLPHGDRSTDWHLLQFARVSNLRQALNSAGATAVPILMEEEGREGNGGLGSAEKYRQAALGAKTGGAAGWVLHNGVFDLSTNTFLSQVDSITMEVIDTLADSLAQPAGSTPLMIVQTCPKAHVDGGSSVTVSCATLPTVGHTMIAVESFGQFGSGQQSCAGSVATNSGGAFNLDATGTVTQYVQACIWSRVVSTAPGGSYSIVKTNPNADDWVTLAAFEVAGLVTTVSLDQTGVASGSGDIASATTGTTSQPDELIVAALAFEISGTATITMPTVNEKVEHYTQATCDAASGGHNCGAAYSYVATSIGQYGGTFTLSQPVPNWSVAVATYRAQTQNGGGPIRTLTWTDNSNDEDGFHLQKRTALTTPNWVDEDTAITVNATSYVTQLTPEETNDCWRIRAWKNGYLNEQPVLQYSDWSNEACADEPPPPPPPPPPPTGLQIGAAPFDYEEDLL